MMSYKGQQVETYDGTPMTACLDCILRVWRFVSGSTADLFCASTILLCNVCMYKPKAVGDGI
jgi:hypothetical protein